MLDQVEIEGGSILKGSPSTPVRKSCSILKGSGETSQTTKVVVESPLAKAVGPLQHRDGSDLAKICELVQNGSEPSQESLTMGSEEFRRLAGMLPQMTIQDGILRVRLNVNDRHRVVIVCPIELRPLVIRETHLQAHSGVHRTYRKIRLTWYWPGMSADIRRAIRNCEICQVSKHGQAPKSSNQQHLYAGRPWQTLSLDLVGPFVETPRGNTMILVIADHFTKWRDAVAIPDGTTASIVDVLERQVFNYFDLPECLHTDRGAQFESQLMEELCTVWGIQKTRTTPYHPQGNGVVERGNKDLGDALRSLLLNRDESDWDILLPQIMRSIRSTPHSITGETPNFLMFGRELSLPDTLISGKTAGDKQSQSGYARDLQKRLEEAFDKVRSYQNNVRAKDTQEPPLYVKKDLVLIKNQRQKKGTSSKLRRKYLGPYVVKEVFENHTYTLERNGKVCKEHESRLKPFQQARQAWGKAAGEGEKSRQPTRAGYAMHKRDTPSAIEKFLARDNNIDSPGNSVAGETLEKSQETGVVVSQNKSSQEKPEVGVVPSERMGVDNSAIAEKRVVSPNCEGTTRSGRAVRKPKHLREFETCALQTHANSLTNEKSTHVQVNINRLAVGGNAITALSSGLVTSLKGFKSREVKESQIPGTMAGNKNYDIDIMEEGELSDNSSISSSSSARTRINNTKSESSTSVKTIATSVKPTEDLAKGKFKFISQQTLDSVKGVMNYIRKEGNCCLCAKEFLGQQVEAIRTHAWSHYILFVCNCSYYASRHDTVKQHQVACHGTQENYTITQIDKANWAVARDFIMLLPARMPELPVQRQALMQRKKRVNSTVVLSKSPPKAELPAASLGAAKAKTVGKVKSSQLGTPPRPVKVTRVEKPIPVTVTLPATDDKENQPVISDADKARYTEEIKELRTSIASQTSISNELRRMSENLERQTDVLRQRMAKLLELVG